MLLVPSIHPPHTLECAARGPRAGGRYTRKLQRLQSNRHLGADTGSSTRCPPPAGHSGHGMTRREAREWRQVGWGQVVQGIANARDSPPPSPAAILSNGGSVVGASRHTKLMHIVCQCRTLCRVDAADTPSALYTRVPVPSLRPPSFSPHPPTHTRATHSCSRRGTTGRSCRLVRPGRTAPAQSRPVGRCVPVTVW